MTDEKELIDIKKAIFDWIRDDTGSAIQMTLDHRKCEKLADRILSALDLPSIKAAARAEAMEEAATIAKKHRLSIQINEELWHEGADWACDRIAEAILDAAKAPE